MNRKGFLCFLVVLAFSSLQLSLAENPVKKELSNAVTIAIEAERINFVRTLMEENSDFIVRQVLHGEALQCTSTPKEIKQKINLALLAFFSAMETRFPGTPIKFGSSRGKKPNIEFMNNNSSVILKRIGNSCQVQYVFHGGKMKREFVEAEITGGLFSQRFMLPPGYSQKVEVRILG